MGPEVWKPQSPTALKPCSEQQTNACDPIPTDGCCSVIPCDLCITWTPYGGDVVYAVASFITDGWYATIAGVSFRAYWQRDYETDECEFIVELDGVVVFTGTCYDVSCRDPGGSTDATIDYEDGVLSWDKVEPRRLELITDPDTFCRTAFCSDCLCSCDCLCVRIVDGYDSSVTEGEICDVSYPCDTPIWEGTVGDYELSIALGRDDYGQCIITPTVDGVEQAAVLAPGCGEMASTITLDDGTTIAVRCKRCGCGDEETPQICCDCNMNVGPPLVQSTLRGTTAAGDACSGFGGASSPGASAHPAGVPDPILKPWNPTEDCVQAWVVRWHDYPSMSCTSAITDIMFVVVRRGYGERHEYIEDHVIPCDWYIVVYATEASTTGDEDVATAFLGVYYEFALCCEQQDNIGDLRYLKTISFTNVGTPYGNYDVTMRHEENILNHGEDCGST